MIPAVVTIMMCTSVDKVATPIEVPGEPIEILGWYTFPDIGVRFDKRRCYVDRIDKGEDDAVQ